jgi:hypothetical protein
MDHQPTSDASTITVRVPMTFRRFGGRKLVVVPEGGEVPAPEPPELDNPLIRALARAFRWRRQLEDGTRKSLGDIARAEKISSSYVTRILRLSTLAPDIVEAALAGQRVACLPLQRLENGMPLAWDQQRQLLLDGDVRSSATAAAPTRSVNVRQARSSHCR